MSSIERQLAPTVVRRKQELTNLYAEERELNLQFPGQRKKKDDQKNPEYLAQRSQILDRIKLLSTRQNATRRQLRKS